MTQVIAPVQLQFQGLLIIEFKASLGNLELLEKLKHLLGM